MTEMAPQATSGQAPEAASAFHPSTAAPTASAPPAPQGPAATGAPAGLQPDPQGAAAVLGHWSESGGAAPAAAAQAAPQPTTYVVKSGDTLSSIAAKLGSTPDAIVKANGLKNPNALSVGQHLTIPVGSGGQASAAHGTGSATHAAGGAAQTADIQYNGNALATVSDAVVKVVPTAYQSYAKTNVPAILQQAATRGVKDANQVAYILATAQHESRFGAPQFSRSQSLVEDHNPYSYNKKTDTWSSTVHTNGQAVSGKTEEQLDTNYWDSAYGGRLGNKKGTSDGADFRGRGFVQLTGRTNYHNMSATLNAQNFSYTIDNVTYGGKGNPPIDLEAHPDHVNRVPELAARIMVDGMQSGSFTGTSLDDEINSKKTDFVNARKIINGDTKENGATIAGYAKTFQGALGGWPSVFVLDQKTDAPTAPKAATPPPA